MNLRAALAAFLTATVLVTSAAADVLFIPTNSATEARNEDSRVTRAVLRKLGIAYTVGVRGNLNVDSVRFGAYKTAAGWRRFDAVVFGGFVRGASSSGIDANTYTLFSGKPPFVPMLYVSSWQTLTGLNTTAACSTGAGAYIDPTAAQDSSRVLHVVGTPYTFRNLNYTCYPLVGNIGTYQTVARYKSAQFGSASAWRDSIDFANENATVDTLAVWIKRFTVSGTTLMRQQVNGTTFTASPIVFCEPSGTGQGSLMVLALALAKLDSLSAGGVFNSGNPVNLSGLVVGGSDWRNDSNGWIPDDSTFVYASYDSLNALGEPFGVTFQPESLTVKSNMASRLLALGNLRFVPYTSQGPGGLGASYGYASSTYPVDPLGRLRAIRMWAGSWTDTSGAARLKYRLDLIRERFGSGRTDAVFFGDAAYSRPMATSPTTNDTLFSLLNGAGYVGYLINTRDDPNSAVRFGGYSGTGSPLNMVNGRGWYRTNPAHRGIVSDSTRRMRLLNMHRSGSWLHYERSVMSPSVILAVNFAAAGAQYDNAMGGDVFYMTGAGMGPDDRAANALFYHPYIRPTFYNAKWLVSAVKAANAARWQSNRPLFRFVSLSEMCMTGPNR